jgi:serine/threonine protein kinase
MIREASGPVMNVALEREAHLASRRRGEEWARLADEFLPLREEGSSWRFSRRMTDDDPAQGWKLHVSATILNANDVLRAIAPLLRERGILFKACATLDQLARLNAGIHYGFSQIGKFLTVYPRTPAEAMRVAGELDELTKEFSAPPVPYDLPYRPGGCVYYRYGGFRTIEVVDPDGRKATAIFDPNGKMWTDRREPGHAVPAWIANPFRTFDDPPALPLRTEFLVYQALSQRGKGGVYEAIDIRELPARRCIVKEGRRNGEVSVDGLDGRDRVVHEERVLAELRAAGVPVPAVVGAFDIDPHRYLALEHLEGTNLMELCARPRRRLPVETASAFGARIARILAGVHAAGWVWRDLKPLNFIVAADGTLRPLDFEGAVRIGEPSSIPWGTPAYTPPELAQGAVTGSNLPEDLYALGATLHQLFTSFVASGVGTHDQLKALDRRPVQQMRRGVPVVAGKTIAALLDPDPRSRPTAAEAARALAALDTTGTLTWPRPVKRRHRHKHRHDEPLPFVDQMPGAEHVVLQNPRRLAYA